MVIPINRFFAPLSNKGNASRPIFTSIPTDWNFSQNGGPSRFGAQNDFRNFWKVFKESPELVATIGVPITDILGDRPEWVKPDGSELGRNKRLEAQKFWRNNRGKENTKAFLYDAFSTGDGYIWKGKPNMEETVRAVKEALENSPIGNARLKPFQVKELFLKAITDEDVKRPRRMDYVAAATMRVIHDQYDIFGYEQQTNGEISKFGVQDIIHWRYMTLNGAVKGYSPVLSLTAELWLLQLVKRNMTSYMRNGGHPDQLYILPKEIAGSRNHEYLISHLRKYKKIDNRHGHMVFTGEIDVKDLQGSPKDLEYKDLALYITSNIAFIYNIPVTRIPYLIGSQATKGDSGGLSESGYWNFISSIQDDLEDLLNGQLFGKLGWHIKFQRKYKQDELREAQTMSMNADTVTKYQDILSKNKKQLTNRKMLSLLGFSSEDIEELEESDVNMQNNMMNQNMLSKDVLVNEQDKQDRNQTKRNVANQEGSKAAATNP